MEEEGYAFYTGLAGISIFTGTLSILSITACGYLLHESICGDDPQMSLYRILFKSLGTGFGFLGVIFVVSYYIFFNHISTLIKVFQLEHCFGPFIYAYLLITMFLLYYPGTFIIYLVAKILSKKREGLTILNLWRP